MVAYLARRIGYAAMVFVGAGLVISSVLAWVPDAQLNLHFGARFGLNLKSFFTFSDQYVVQGLASAGPFSVGELLQSQTQKSLILIAGALTLLVSVGVSTGVVSVLKPYSRVWNISSRMLHSLSVVPVLVWGLIVLYIGITGFEVLIDTSFIRVDALWWKPIVVYGLASLILAVGDSTLSDVIRLVHLETKRIMEQDYIRALKARNIRLWPHLFRGLVAPVLSVLAGKIPYLIGGTIVVEYLFSIQGLGYALLDAVRITKNYFFVLMATLLLVGIVLFVNLIRDMVAVFSDPRIRANSG